MTVTVSNASLDAQLAHDVMNLMEEGPHQHTLAERFRASTKAGAHAGFVASAEGEVVGYAHLQESASESDQWFLDTFVPTAIPRVEHVTESLLTAARGRCRGQALQWWTEGRHADVVATVANRCGFPLFRRVIKMHRRLEELGPVDQETWRTFRESDAARVVEINNTAFAGHPDRDNWTVDTLMTTLDDAADLLLMPGGDRPDGFCWLKHHDDEVGELFVLASHPDVRGGGLGRKLLRRGLQLLSDRGHQVAELYVEQSNERAIALYEAEGFTFADRILTAYLVPPLDIDADDNCV